MNFQELKLMNNDQLLELMSQRVEELKPLLQKKADPENPERKEIFEDFQNITMILSGRAPKDDDDF